MSRMTLPRSITALTLVLGLNLLSPAWAAERSPRRPTPPVPAAAHQPDAVEALRAWLQAVLAKLAPGSGGKPVGIEGGGSCSDPNGGCT
jgi:hypothetical protein